MLNDLKMMLGNREYNDAMLSLLLDAVAAEVLDYTNQKELNNGLKSVVIQIALMRLNQLGSEGLTAENFGGVSQSFLNDLPPFITSILNSNRKIRIVG